MTRSETIDRLRKVASGLAMGIAIFFSIATVSEPGDVDLQPLVDSGVQCQERRWFSDEDGDGHGSLSDTVISCARPVGWVELGDDNCPEHHNPEQLDSDGDGAGDACDAEVQSCDDLSEGGAGISLLGVADDSAQTSVAELGADAAVYDERALRITTQSGTSAGLRIALDGSASMDASPFSHLLLAVRGHNNNVPAWQGTGPILVLEDVAGNRRSLSPVEQQLGLGGEAWQRLRVPVTGGETWRASGDAVDLTRLRAVEVRADTWGAGFVLDVDGVTFGDVETSCAYRCPTACSGRGHCDVETLSCQCELGATGPLCQGCGNGFSLQGERCLLDQDGEYDFWPNPVSAANSDPWLAVHHDKIRLLQPRVLVLNFSNDSSLEGAQQLIDNVIAGFREASRSQGGGGAPQLDYAMARGIVDLRDGEQGRPGAPPGWPYLNSTLMPRLNSASNAAHLFDYSVLFGEAFADHYGYDDPAQAGEHLTLCELVDAGEVHEVWVITSGDPNDAAMAEVLESKPRYDAAGNRLEGSVDTCAGNGCFAAEVPVCERMVRIGSVNYHRGSGCYLHSQAHGLESAGGRNLVPQLSEWFVPFARFDLDQRYDLPFANLYGLGCNDYDGNGEIEAPCLEYPAPGSALLHHGTGNLISVQPWDPACGNVHFAPNATWHYEADNPNSVLSSCDDFGRGHGGAGADALSPVSAASWSDLEPLAPDCSGGFLIWWFRHMPGFGSDQTYLDGRRMAPVWPFLFY